MLHESHNTQYIDLSCFPSHFIRTPTYPRIIIYPVCVMYMHMSCCGDNHVALCGCALFGGLSAEKMSADAIEDEWWLEGSGTTPEDNTGDSSAAKRKRNRTEDDAVRTGKKKRRRRLKADDLVEEPFSTLHKARRQREELLKSFQSATDEDLRFKSVCANVRVYKAL